MWKFKYTHGEQYMFHCKYVLKVLFSVHYKINPKNFVNDHNYFEYECNIATI